MHRDKISNMCANCAAESAVTAVGSMFSVFALSPKSTSQKHK